MKKGLILFTILNISLFIAIILFGGAQNTADELSAKPVDALKIVKKVQESYSKYNKKYIIIVDFTKSSLEKRLFVYDTQLKTIVYSTHVAQGKSPPFSNIEGSHQSSVGVYLTGNTYKGKHGTSRFVYGQDKGYNDNAFKRSIVIHSASYIGNGKQGRSQGCFAVPIDAIDAVLKYSESGTLIVAYYPSNVWSKYGN